MTSLPRNYLHVKGRTPNDIELFDRIFKSAGLNTITTYVARYGGGIHVHVDDIEAVRNNVDSVWQAGYGIGLREQVTFQGEE